MVYPTLQYEKELWNLGFRFIAGVDEVGRGAFAGPVVVGAVVFPQGSKIIKGVADSKLLTPKAREYLAERVKGEAESWAVATVSVSVINKVGIGKATQMAFRKAIKSLSQSPDFILIDAFLIKGIKKEIQKPIIKGDRDCYSIAAASIVAKVYRDQLMERLDCKHPEYFWKYNKGYGTAKHRESIVKNGLSKHHRHWKIG